MHLSKETRTAKLREIANTSCALEPKDDFEQSLVERSFIAMSHAGGVRS
jgi:hypothetical protein